MFNQWQKFKKLPEFIVRMKTVASQLGDVEMLLSKKAEIESLLSQARSQTIEVNNLLENLKTHEAVFKSFQEDLDLLQYCQSSVAQAQPPLLVKKSLKIGCSYNIANNFYSLVNCMQRSGTDAELLLWRGYDYSVLADPRWEVERVIVQDFNNEDLRVLNGDQPPHVREIPSMARELVQQVTLPYPRHLLNAWGYLENNVDEYIAAMREYDILLVSGQAVILAPFVGKPYVTFPHGGDLYITPFGNEKINRLCRAGWQRAAAHILSGGHFYRYADRLGLRNCTYIPILIDTDRYSPGQDVAFRSELLQRFHCDFIFAVPSRHDWEWKGTDKIINAVARVNKQAKKKFAVMFFGWGNDLEKSRALIRELRLEQTGVFVGAMSKPALHDYINAADVVLDQFTLGEYGTLTLESMSLEKPVMLYYKGSVMPPIINAFSTEEIADRMLFALDHPGDIQALGVKARKWVTEHHGPTAVVPKFRQVIEAVVNGQEIPQFPRIM